MTTALKPYPELQWKVVWSNINQQTPAIRSAYLDEHYAGKIPPYEGVEFQSGDSATVFRLLPNDEYEAFTYNVTQSGLVRIMEKGFLLVRPADRQLAGRRIGVESPVATAVQPTVVTDEDGPEVAADGPPPPPVEDTTVVMEQVIDCPECTALHPKGPGFYRRHLVNAHDLQITKASAKEIWNEKAYMRPKKIMVEAAG